MSDLKIYISSLPGMTDEELVTEARSASALLSRARKSGTRRAVSNLEKMREALKGEKAGRKEAEKNPRKKKAKKKAKKKNPGESTLSSYAGKVARMTDRALRAEHKKMVKTLRESRAPVRHFGTEGLALFKQMIVTAENEMRSRGLTPNPKKNVRGRGSGADFEIVDSQNIRFTRGPTHEKMVKKFTIGRLKPLRVARHYPEGHGEDTDKTPHYDYADYPKVDGWAVRVMDMPMGKASWKGSKSGAYWQKDIEAWITRGDRETIARGKTFREAYDGAVRRVADNPKKKAKKKTKKKGPPPEVPADFPVTRLPPGPVPKRSIFEEGPMSGREYSGAAVVATGGRALPKKIENPKRKPKKKPKKNAHRRSAATADRVLRQWAAGLTRQDIVQMHSMMRMLFAQGTEEDLGEFAEGMKRQLVILEEEADKRNISLKPNPRRRNPCNEVFLVIEEIYGEGIHIVSPYESRAGAIKVAKKADESSRRMRIGFVYIERWERDASGELEEKEKIEFPKKNPKKNPKKVGSLVAFLKLPAGTVVAAHGYTGNVVRHHSGMIGLYAVPTHLYESNEAGGFDPLGSGARYFFAEDLEEFFREGRKKPRKSGLLGRGAAGTVALGPVGWRRKDNPKKKAKKRTQNGRSNISDGTVIDGWVVKYWAWGPPSHKNGPYAVMQDPEGLWELLIQKSNAHLRPAADRQLLLGRVTGEEWVEGWQGEKALSGTLMNQVQEAIAWAKAKIRKLPSPKISGDEAKRMAKKMLAGNPKKKPRKNQGKVISLEHFREHGEVADAELEAIYQLGESLASDAQRGGTMAAKFVMDMYGEDMYESLHQQGFVTKPGPKMRLTKKGLAIAVREHAKHEGAGGYEYESNPKKKKAKAKKKAKKKMSSTGRVLVAATTGAVVAGPLGALGLGYAATKWRPTKIKDDTPVKRKPRRNQPKMLPKTFPVPSGWKPFKMGFDSVEPYQHNEAFVSDNGEWIIVAVWPQYEHTEENDLAIWYQKKSEWDEDLQATGYPWHGDPSSKVFDPDEYKGNWGKTFDAAVDWLKKMYSPTGKRKPLSGQAAEALRHINQARARKGLQGPLDPAASGWLDAEVIAEAKRLGWKPNPRRKNPSIVEKQKREERLEKAEKAKAKRREKKRREGRRRPKMNPERVIHTDKTDPYDIRLFKHDDGKFWYQIYDPSYKMIIQEDKKSRSESAAAKHAQCTIDKELLVLNPRTKNPMWVGSKAVPAFLKQAEAQAAAMSDAELKAEYKTTAKIGGSAVKITELGTRTIEQRSWSSIRLGALEKEMKKRGLSLNPRGRKRVPNGMGMSMSPSFGLHMAIVPSEWRAVEMERGVWGVTDIKQSAYPEPEGVGESWTGEDAPSRYPGDMVTFFVDRAHPKRAENAATRLADELNEKHGSGTSHKSVVRHARKFGQKDFKLKAQTGLATELSDISPNPAGRDLKKKLRKIIREAEKQGWKSGLTRGGHIRLRSPSGGIVHASATPSDPRAIKNILSDMKREGYQPAVNPKDPDAPDAVLEAGGLRGSGRSKKGPAEPRIWKKLRKWAFSPRRDIESHGEMTKPKAKKYLDSAAKSIPELRTANSWEQASRFFDSENFHGLTEPAWDRAQALKAKKKKSKKKAKKRSKKRETLIGKSRRLWDGYVEKPTKKALKSVLDHLEDMEASGAKTVKAEWRRAKRVAKDEAKRLGMKV